MRPLVATSPFSPLRHDRFRALWLAGLVSFLGTWVHNVAARWTASTLTESPLVVSAVDTLQLLPMVLLSLAAGTLADRTDRRQLLVLTHGGLATVAALMAVSAWTGHMDLPRLLAFTACIGLFGALNGPAWQATVPRQVPDAEVPRAVALMSTGFNLARAVGPGLGAWLLVTVGPGWAFAANAASYLVIGGLIWRLPPQPPYAGGADEAHLPLQDPRLVRFYLVAAFFGLFAMPGLSLLPLVARDLVQGAAATYGLLLSAFGMGAVAAGLLMGGLVARVGARPMIALTTVTSAAGFAILSNTVAPWQAVTGAAVCGAGWIGTLSTVNAGVQMQADRAVRARALAWYLTFAVGGQAAGSFLGGALAGLFGLAAALGIHAVLLAGLSAVVTAGIPRRPEPT